MTAMSSPATSDSLDPASREEFKTALNELVGRARSNDVDVCGGYRCDDGTEPHAFGIEIYRVVA